MECCGGEIERMWGEVLHRTVLLVWLGVIILSMVKMIAIDRRFVAGAQRTF